MNGSETIIKMFTNIEGEMPPEPKARGDVRNFSPNRGQHFYIT